MTIFHPSIILFSGFIFDLVIGDPGYRCHPVRIIGNLISTLLKLLNACCRNRTLTGVLLTILTILFSVLVYSLLFLVFNRIHPLAGFMLNLYFVYSLIALKDLFNHCHPVIDALMDNDLEKARKSIGMIVGRDVNYLDETGIIRAAIETLAENFVDGFLSPVFWYIAGCLAGAVSGINPVYSGVVLLLIFKVASTLDSMVGYKTEELRETGRSGARLDDIMNFLPARLSIIILYVGAALSGLAPVSGLRISLRDRLKHESPNSAHSESFVAGAIRARLGGPTKYYHGLKQKPWLGEEFKDPELDDIRRVIKLLLYSSWFTVFIFAGILCL